MRTCKHKQAAGCAALGILAITVCLALCGNGKILGADGDWLSQHSVIADYFRQQFYETGQLFPEFAANIGGGQNIYNFSYYGLYSPVILVSYLLPFVKMGDYLMAASVLGLIASAVLFYCWMMKRGFSQMISLGTAAMFLLSGPMVFQSYSQVMFVNYMPFLCLALWGIDRYFLRNKAGLFTVSVFLMIMTSFYFSIGGMIVLVLYGLHRYFQLKDERGNRVTVSGFMADGVRFAIPMVTAVMMSGILLVPTALALSGRSEEIEKVSLSKLLCPEVRILRFVYSPYGIGLTILVITVLITGLTYRKLYERVLVYGSVIILVIPVFAWVLNGGLYIRDKVMIPFLPLLCYMTACYLEKLKKRELSFLNGFLPYLVTLGFLYMGRNQGNYAKYWKFVMLDGIIMAVCFLAFYWKEHVLCLIVPPVVFLLVFAGGYHVSTDGMEDKEFYDRVTDGEIGTAIEKVLEEEDGFYRMEQMGTGRENTANINRIWNMGQYVSSIYSSTYHEDYQYFRNNVFETEEPFRNFLMQSVSGNPLFQKFMGVKYLVVQEKEDEGAEKTETSETDSEKKEKEAFPGYELYETIGNIKIYCNEDVSPIAYGTDRIMPGEVYENLDFPYNQLALMTYAVVDDEVMKKQKVIEESSNVEIGNQDITIESSDVEIENQDKIMKYRDIWDVLPAEIDIPEREKDGSSIERISSGYHVQMKSSKKMNIGIHAEAGEKKRILFVRFQVKNNRPSKDIFIDVEGVRNKLTTSSHIYYNGNTTFTYAVGLDQDQEKVEFTFGKGDYEITDVQSFLVPWNQITERKENESLESKEVRDEFHPDKKMTKGNLIAGSIDIKNDGYFITTIPYDENFEVRVDGKNAAYEKVNTAFLGFKIGKGSHEIEILYHAPGLMFGKIMSLVGILILGVCLVKEMKKETVYLGKSML